MYSHIPTASTTPTLATSIFSLWRLTYPLPSVDRLSRFKVSPQGIKVLLLGSRALSLTAGRRLGVAKVKYAENFQTK